ncbi:tRNA (adenosine(37)-N6)-dimethylallyltransferase MiaA [Acetobacter farinalis]|uniref:tRNA dimethylallyltransferase n=1 Tax=Acetobacter farinalis TaxID=1260984 RepID=A0ABT3Q6V5_9PROT|nr:tRNA (adenosine(37)-N6)-dimethylallyltransferase MiaA [Acetobacter farinalis]MCX2561013.1 tRNA (adenosine(37)-N6)-dimethylallyltransferase MiaA [Acetobacter farinalis]NHO29737.1 tRNA (adenosine(37)-N6)-dimethylallyltransferase MiaA [Acetobacter farinalis]
MKQAEDQRTRPAALIIAGPTCSGKSALALTLAQRFGGTIINADSMQVYTDLRVLTARPDEADEQAAPHRLYGVLPASEKGSVAWWRTQALAAMEEAWATGRLPILCGGTGMYLRALTDGLAEIPECGEEARAEARALVAEEGAPALHARLAEVDPEMAARLQPVDSQRVSRAWEVWRGTGRSLAWWQAQPGLPPAPCRFVAVRLLPPRPDLRARIAARFEAMLAQGAMEEVQALLAQKLDPALPAMRAHGVPELAAVLRGEMSVEDATRLAILATGRYTRRQATWFAHHALAEEGLTYDLDICASAFGKFSERKLDEIISFILSGIDDAHQVP